MRLQKYMALCGVASRRRSEQMIAEGRVRVNDQPVLTPGVIITEDDIVTVDGKLIREEMHEYILLNKPKGVVCTSSDHHAEKTVSDLIGSQHRLYTVGRLDKDTEGLLILTNDGDLTYKLTHPKHAFPKTYACLIKGKINESQIEQLSIGVSIETDEGTYMTHPAKVEMIKKTMGASLIHVTISEGKKRQVRKMCAAVGHPVIELKRIALGELRDDRLKVGHWRQLTSEELKYLREV